MIGMIGLKTMVQVREGRNTSAFVSIFDEGAWPDSF